MAEFKNPFASGDIIWWERRGVPVAFYYVMDGDMVCGLDGFLMRDLEAVVRGYKIINEVDGPYRIDKAENWSAYKFGIWESRL